MGWRHAKVHPKFLQEQLVQRGLVSRVYPIARGRAFLLALGVAVHNPIVSLGAGDGRREPDLLVWGLLVDYVGAGIGEGDGEDTSLEVFGQCFVAFGVCRGGES